MKDPNKQALEEYERQEVKDDLEREEYHKRLAAKVGGLRANEGDFLEALQRAVENIDDEQLDALRAYYGHYSVEGRRMLGNRIARMLDYQFDLMAKEELGEE
jgi:hypothetical protein